MSGMISLLKCAQWGHMGAAYSIITTLAAGLPMVISWSVMGSLVLALAGAATLSFSPLRKYQPPPPAISTTAIARIIQPLRDMTPPKSGLRVSRRFFCWSLWLSPARQRLQRPGQAFRALIAAAGIARRQWA